MRINALLSGVSPVVVRGVAPSRSSLGGTQASPRQDLVSADVFEQGQAWKNLAAAGSTGVAGAKSCSCKTCPACAAQAYVQQAGAGKGLSAPAVAAGRKEEKAAAASGASGQEKPVAAGNGSQDTGENGAGSAQESPQAALGAKIADTEALSQAERLQVAELAQIDTAVRAHELAHLAAAGSYATGGASFQYAKGPDGKQYAVGGEVGIDTGKESSPEATISKMQTVRAAALAPASPSPQDQKVAARASQVITEVSQELQMIRLEQTKGKIENKSIAPAGVAGTPSPEIRGKGVGAGDQQAKEDVSGQKPSANMQRAAAAIMDGLMRPVVSRIHIAV